MRPGAMAAAAAKLKLPRLTTSAALFPTPSPFGSRPAPKPMPPPPVSISMDPAAVDPSHLQALMLACAHSCAIRPSPPPAAAEPVDLRKLRVALAHSFLVVSVSCSARFLEDGGGGDGQRLLGLGLGLGRQEDRRLVGFGRAVSDVGLTASLHDVVVDVSSTVQFSSTHLSQFLQSTPQQRPFFEACGFGDDAMGSTTMMYTRKMHR